MNAAGRRLLFIASDLGWHQNSVSCLLIVRPSVRPSVCQSNNNGSKKNHLPPPLILYPVRTINKCETDFWRQPRSDAINNNLMPPS